MAQITFQQNTIKLDEPITLIFSLVCVNDTFQKNIVLKEINPLERIFVR